MKKMIKTEIFSKTSTKGPILFKDITIKIELDDEILAGYDEGFYSENESWDPHYYLKISRERLETDEEFEKRKKEEDNYHVFLKNRRYENYLKLKKEFEKE